MNGRQAVLEEALKITTGDRNVQYGDPNEDFQRTAEMWNARFRDKLQPEEQFEAHDVAVAQILLKVSRTTWSPDKKDHWVDIAGYAGCGYDCVPGIEEPKPNAPSRHEWHYDWAPNVHVPFQDSSGTIQPLEVHPARDGNEA